LCFAHAANAIPLSTLGIMQYLTPLMQLGFGVLIYHEPMPVARLIGFCLVWCALVVFTFDGFRASRTPRSGAGLVDDLHQYPGGRREPVSDALG